MKFKYEGLDIWQMGVELIKVVNKILKKYPDEEKYVLVTHGAIL
ncbi:MAG: four helix bundle protein [Candidatus Cloacimonadota bacterium]|nr:MAG: four helix bundle protein [Candidatus Cloacimonadota bacterium]